MSLHKKSCNISVNEQATEEVRHPSLCSERMIPLL